MFQDQRLYFLIVFVLMLGTADLFAQASTRSHRVTFDGVGNLYGAKGYVDLEIELSYYFEPYFLALVKDVVVESMPELSAVEQQALARAGITFPIHPRRYSLRFDYRVLLKSGEGSADIIDDGRGNFHVDEITGSGQEFPEFSNGDQTLERLKGAGGAGNGVVAAEMSGGELFWKRNGVFDEITPTEIALLDLKNEVARAIREYKDEKEEGKDLDEEGEEDLAGQEKSDFWSGKGEARDDISGTAGETSGSVAAADGFWVGQGTREEEQQLEKKIADETDNEYLGEKEVVTREIEIAYFDHGQIDGDRVSVLLNGQVVASNITLALSPQSVKVRLRDGTNRVSFQALNEGTTSPNTATFYIYDGNGNEIYQNAWNITEGYRSTLLVIKN